MYLLMIVALMLVLPVASIAIEWSISGGADFMFLVGKWFVFWAAGIRLLLAGARQVTQPAFTARTIFESDDPGAQKVVQELGFGNIAMGAIGVIALVRPSFMLPAAVAAGLFYGFAGFRHVGNPGKNSHELAATVSDIFIFLVLAIVVIDRIAIGAF